MKVWNIPLFVEVTDLQQDTDGRLFYVNLHTTTFEVPIVRSLKVIAEDAKFTRRGNPLTAEKVFRILGIVKDGLWIKATGEIEASGPELSEKGFGFDLFATETPDGKKETADWLFTLWATDIDLFYEEDVDGPVELKFSDRKPADADDENENDEPE